MPESPTRREIEKRVMRYNLLNCNVLQQRQEDLTGH
jgi:hypothetical protein